MADAAPRLRVRRRCWRVLAPRWAAEPLSGAGAARHGGRFNEPGTPALYVSEDLMTAVAEYEQDLGIRPGTFCAYEVDVDGIVDLTDPTVREGLGTTPGDIACPWKEIALVRRQRPPTWELAARLIAAGCAGLRAPSVRQPGGVNLVLWRWNDDPARTVTVHDPQGDLPADQTSWYPRRH